MESTRQRTAGPGSAPSIASHLTWLDTQIRVLEEQIEILIQHPATLRLAASLLRTIPSIGPLAQPR
jgi:hypothetical protein